MNTYGSSGWKVSIPSESGLFLRLLADIRVMAYRLFQSPQNRGYSSDLPWICQGCGAEVSFQSPQNRGYSSDADHNISTRLAAACFNPLRIGAIPQIRWALYFSSSWDLRFNPLRIGAIPQIRNGTHYLIHRGLGFNPLRIGAIPQIYSVWWLIVFCTHCFNPLRIGAIPQILHPRPGAGGWVVSIPSESGLFLRWRHVLARVPAGVVFQSPQNRGYSSDCICCKEAATHPGRFNPLRIGAIPQITTINTSSIRIR